jgi:alkanesulfonate monooxygenase SsuD/methylene tetrahydromethanopterin reductase-like flavin-dependent oxidoreductase (luciferase family)
VNTVLRTRRAFLTHYALRITHYALRITQYAIRITYDFMKFGIQLPEVEFEATWRQIKEMAIVAEQVGMDSVWVGDHLLYEMPSGRRGPWECWSMLAALAAVTERVELGPLVAATAFHQPAMLAKKAATVDEISGGRLILGLGAGWNRAEFEAFGFPFDQRVSRFEEAFTIARLLLREGTVDFAGHFYTVRDCELLPRPRPGGMPLMVGSVGKRMLAITLPHVQYWNAWYNKFDNHPHQVAGLVAEIDQACLDNGRPPAEVEKSVAVLLQFEKEPLWREAVSPITGSPREMADSLVTVAEAGISHIQMVLDPVSPHTIEQAANVAALVRAEF